MRYLSPPSSRRRDHPRRAARFVPGADDRADLLERRTLLATITVNTFADSTDSPTSTTISLRDAVTRASNTTGATEIDLPAGTYNLTQANELLVGNLNNQSITIKGLGTAANTIINQTVANTRIFNFDNNQTGNETGSLINLTIQGATNVNQAFGGGAVIAGGGGDSLTVSGCIFQNDTALSQIGGAIGFGGGGNLTISNSTFANNASNGTSTGGGLGGAVSFDNGTNTGNLSITNSTFANNKATETANGAIANAGALFVSGVGTLAVSGSTFIGNSAGQGGSSPGDGGAIEYEDLNSTTLAITNSTFLNNTAATGGGAIHTTGGTLTISGSRFHANSSNSGSAILNAGAALTANNDWWGADAFPGAAGTDTVVTTFGSTTTATRLALALSPASSRIGANSSTTLTAQIVSATATSTSTTPIAGTALDGVSLAFAPGTLGSVSPTSVVIANGVASSTFTAGSTAGTTSPSITLDNGTKATSITVVGGPTANNQSVSTNFNAATAITLTASDPNNPPLSLTYTVVAAPAHGTLSGTAPNLTYTPSANYHGADSFTFVANNGFATSNTATVSITVGVGTPTANPQAVAVAHDSPGTAITLTDSDPDTPPLTQTYAIATGPGHGTLGGFNASTGAVIYTPAAGYHGPDSFTFTAKNGTNTSSPATVTLGVATGTPTANAQSVAVTHDGSATSTLTSTDDDNPTLTPSYTLVGTPKNGSLTSFNSSTGAFTYSPNAGFHGTDSFTFTASNGTNTSPAATVTLTVATGTPVATGQSVAVAHDSTGQAITLTSTDDDNPTLTPTYTVATAPAHGTLSGSGANLTYKPSAGYHGADSFTFTASNGTNTSSAATVTLTVGVGTPTANAQSVTTNQGSAVAITLTDSDDDTPALPQSYSFAQPAHGTVTVSGPAGSPTVVYTPAAGYSGPDSFTFAASNGTNTGAPATVSIAVAPVAATVSGTVGVGWGSAGTAILQTNADGLRLLPAGRTVDMPWLGIRTLSITLSQPAALAPGDVIVTGINVANYGPATVSGSGTSYTITLAQPINAADRVTVTIGNANIATFTRRLDVLPGDFNDDGGVTQQDAIGIRNQYLGFAGATPTIFGDINGDGVVDVNDYNTTRRMIGTVLP